MTPHPYLFPETNDSSGWESLPQPEMKHIFFNLRAALTKKSACELPHIQHETSTRAIGQLCKTFASLSPNSQIIAGPGTQINNRQSRQPAHTPDRPKETPPQPPIRRAPIGSSRRHVTNTTNGPSLRLRPHRYLLPYRQFQHVSATTESAHSSAEKSTKSPTRHAWPDFYLSIDRNTENYLLAYRYSASGSPVQSRTQYISTHQ